MDQGNKAASYVLVLLNQTKCNFFLQTQQMARFQYAGLGKEKA